jgi:DNA-binding MarR family transcriptional regulator
LGEKCYGQPGGPSIAGREWRSDGGRGAGLKKESRSLAGLDKLIHDPSRLMILTALYLVGEMSFLRLQRDWGYTRGNLSGHLRKLERAGYVAVKKGFKKKYPVTVCSLTKAGRDALQSYAMLLKCLSGTTKSTKHSKS